jgi:hypothetical protein
VTLTHWRAQRQGQVRTAKVSEQEGGAHPLERGAGTSQDIQSNGVRVTHGLESADGG